MAKATIWIDTDTQTPKQKNNKKKNKQKNNTPPPTMGTMGRGPERVVPHTGTETRTRLLREAAVRNIGQIGRASCRERV